MSQSHMEEANPLRRTAHTVCRPRWRTWWRLWHWRSPAGVWWFCQTLLVWAPWGSSATGRYTHHLGAKEMEKQTGWLINIHFEIIPQIELFSLDWVIASSLKCVLNTSSGACKRLGQPFVKCKNNWMLNPAAAARIGEIDSVKCQNTTVTANNNPQNMRITHYNINVYAKTHYETPMARHLGTVWVLQRLARHFYKDSRSPDWSRNRPTGRWLEANRLWHGIEDPEE